MTPIPTLGHEPVELIGKPLISFFEFDNKHLQMLGTRSLGF